MPLSDMLRFMVESNDPATWEANRQKRIAGEYELESKRRALEAEQQLRDLYAKNPNPSFGAMAAISPEHAQKMQQYQNEQYLKNLQAQETKGKVDLQNADQAAAAAFPALVTYEENIQRGMPEQQAREIFHSMNGKVVADAAQSGASWLQSGASYDPNKVDPENVRALNARFGRFTPLEKLRQESQTEAMKTGYGIQQKQAPSFSDRYFTGPDGRLYPNPYYKAGGEQPVEPKIKPYPVFEFEGKTYKGPEFMRMTIREKDPVKKQRMEAIMDAGFQQEQEGTLTDPNAVELPKTKQELEIETAREKKKAELAVEGEHEAEQQLSTLKALDAQNVESLIDKSFHSKPEAMAKGEYGLSGMAGMPTEANTAYKELVVIEAQMRDMAKAIVGAGPISEGEQKIIKDALGGVSTPGDATSRKSAYRKFVDLAKAKISRYPHLAQQMKAIEDMAGKETATPTQQPSGKSLKIGDIDEGMEYLGGNPNSASSWKKVK